MVTIARSRRTRILSAALAMFLAAPNAFANSPETTSFAALAEVLKTGDLIAVTPWSGKKLKGELVEMTDCSIRLRTAGKALSMETAAVKTVRRYPLKARAAKSAWGAVERCDRVECAPATLAVVGVAALVKSLRDAGGAEIVYRGRRDHAPARGARSAAVPARSRPGTLDRDDAIEAGSTGLVASPVLAAREHISYIVSACLDTS